LDHFTIYCGKVFVDEIQNYGKLLESSERTIDEYNGLLG